MISIVIPARQESAYLRETLRYIKHSLTIPHEVIVSDGGSTDDTVAIAHELADTVVVFPGGRKHNPAIGRNDGARVAQGEFLLFMDADSRMQDIDAHLKRALAYFQAHPMILGLTGPQIVYPEATWLSAKIVFGIDNVMNRVRNNVFKSGWGSGKCLFVRRAAFEKIGGFREELVFGEDFNLFQRLAEIGETRFLPWLITYHSGRRLRAYGIVKFWYVWLVNGIAVLTESKARVAEWTPVR